jgi:hypothetical protein
MMEWKTGDQASSSQFLRGEMIKLDFCFMKTTSKKNLNTYIIFANYICEVSAPVRMFATLIGSPFHGTNQFFQSL